jgi:hypothetical protein
MNCWSISTGRRRLRALVVGVGIAASLGAALPIASASAADGSTPLGYEKVTPAGKGAGAISSLQSFTSSLDGDSLLYTTYGSFDSYPSASVPVYTRYLGSRGPDGWETRAQDVPDLHGNNTLGGGAGRNNGQTVIAASWDLAYTMVATSAALTPGATERGGNLYLRNAKTGALKLIATTTEAGFSDDFLGLGGQIRAKSVASDGRAALFQTRLSLLPGAPAAALYSWREGRGLRVESVLPTDEGGGMVTVGATGMDNDDGPRDSIIYDDALTRVYFSEGGGAGGVYVREGDETKLISRSRIPGDPSTPVRGTVETVQGDGRSMIFQTDAPLTESTPTTGETAGAQHIYRYDATDESLTYIGSTSAYSSTPILQTSPDGQAVAFQSMLQLVPGASSGSTNYYVWRNGTLRLAAVSEPDGAIGAGLETLRGLSPNGRYLVFTDVSTIRSESFGAPNISRSCPRMIVGGPGPCTQLYVYDAVADKLSCASCRPDGLAPLSDAGDPGMIAEERPPNYPGRSVFLAHMGRMAHDDGSVLFTTRDGLVSEDGNGAKDVYRWRDGQVQMLSRGLAGHDSRFLDTSADGKTVFFSTSDAILPIDTDRSVDIYMTRPGAGFPDPPADTTPRCTGGDCRDVTPAMPPLALPGSAGLLGAFKEADRARSSAVGQPRVASKATVSGSSGIVKVTVSGPGRLSVSGNGLRSSALSVTEAGRYHLVVRLSAAGSRSLSRKKRRVVGATVRFVPRVGKSGAVKVALTFKSKKGR